MGTTVTLWWVHNKIGDHLHIREAGELDTSLQCGMVWLSVSGWKFVDTILWRWEMSEGYYPSRFARESRWKGTGEHKRWEGDAGGG